MSELHDKTRELLASDLMRASEQTFAGIPLTTMIRELLAENERLTAMVTALKLLTNRLDQDRADLSARAEAAEAACENLGVTPKQAAEGLSRYKAREARIAYLEARLRELASAEPVLWCCEKTGFTDDRQHGTYTIPLIRRPEMP